MWTISKLFALVSHKNQPVRSAVGTTSLFFPSADDPCWLVGRYTTNHHHRRRRRRIHCRTQKFPFRHLHNRCSPVQRKTSQYPSPQKIHEALNQPRCPEQGMKVTHPRPSASAGSDAAPTCPFGAAGPRTGGAGCNMGWEPTWVQARGPPERVDVGSAVHIRVAPMVVEDLFPLWRAAALLLGTGAGLGVGDVESRPVGGSEGGLKSCVLAVDPLRDAGIPGRADGVVRGYVR